MRLAELTLNLLHLCTPLEDVDRQANDTILVCDSVGDRLANPPVGIGGEFTPLGGVELLHGLVEAQTPFLNQGKQGQSPALIFFGDGDHKSEVY